MEYVIMKKLFFLGMGVAGLVGAGSYTYAALESELESESKVAAEDSASVQENSQENLDCELVVQVKAAARFSSPRLKDKHLLQIRELLALGASPNARDYGNVSVLKIAVRSGWVDVVKELLDAGANVDETDNGLIEQFIFSGVASNLGMVKILVEAGADVNKRNRDGISVLMFALERKRERHLGLARYHSEFFINRDREALAIIRMLIIAGARIDTKVDGGITAQEYAQCVGLENEVVEAVALRDAYESRLKEISDSLKDDDVLPCVLINLIKEYEEVDEELAFLVEREKNLKKRANSSR